MSQEIIIHNELTLNGSLTFEQNLTDFPTTPRHGQIVSVNGRHYAYTQLAPSYFSWLPIAIKQSSYIHSQGVPSTTWTIPHNLGSTNYGLFVYDDDHKLVFATHAPIDSNTITVTLVEAIAGTAVVFAVTDFSATNFAATQLAIGSGSISYNEASDTFVFKDSTGTPLSFGISSLSGFTTDELDEGTTNKYLTDARAATFATLENGKIKTSQLPAIAITDTYIANSEAAMLALSSAETGDVAIRTDLHKSFILKGTSYSTLADWAELLTPTESVSSVAGKTGVVTIALSDLTSIVGLPYDLATSTYGKPSASEVVIRFRAPRAFTVSNVQTNGQAKAGTGATASTVFTVAKNGTSIGTITFAAAGTTGTISIASATAFAVGDLFTITAPAIADTTLADIDFTLVATLS